MSLESTIYFAVLPPYIHCDQVRSCYPRISRTTYNDDRKISSLRDTCRSHNVEIQTYAIHVDSCEVVLHIGSVDPQSSEVLFTKVPGSIVSRYGSKALSPGLSADDPLAPKAGCCGHALPNHVAFLTPENGCGGTGLLKRSCPTLKYD